MKYFETHMKKTHLKINNLTFKHQPCLRKIVSLIPLLVHLQLKGQSNIENLLIELSCRYK